MTLGDVEQMAYLIWQHLATPATPQSAWTRAVWQPSQAVITSEYMPFMMFFVICEWKSIISIEKK